MHAIEVTGLHKVYRGWFGRSGHPALRGVDLAVPVGASFGLIGQNGAGKTTFIKILLGVVRSTAGTVRVLGGDPEDPAVRGRIGYLPERLHLPDAWTPSEFLASVARLKRIGMGRSELDALVARVGLAEAARRKIGGFSKGMRQRVGLAAALIGTPDLLVLDEPTDGIDPLGRVDIRRILAEEVARGATLFLNSHLLAETERVCAQVAILSAGRVVQQGAIDQLRRREQRWRVRFAPDAPEAALLSAGFERTTTSGVWTFSGGDEGTLNRALDQARASGALLVELTIQERDLEQILADAVEHAA
ncbi:MAG: ABC transporter ATP-binding protein [Myxococcaceae bacterium]